MARRPEVIEFETLPWESVVPKCRAKQVVRGGQLLRLVEFEQGFEEVGWCEKGHVGFVLDGELEIEFENDKIRAKAGDGLCIPEGNAHKHRATVLSSTVRLILIEGSASQ